MNEADEGECVVSMSEPAEEESRHIVTPDTAAGEGPEELAEQPKEGPPLERNCFRAFVVDKFCLLGRHLRGALLVRFLAIRNRGMVRRLRPLALHLETQVFPRLQKARIQWLLLTVARGEDGAPYLAGRGDSQDLAFPGTERLAGHLRRMGVRSVRLETELESGQIVESLLTLVYAHRELENARPSDEPYAGWSRQRIASALLGEEGFHKFCARMRFNRDLAQFEVQYSYCELFFSRVIKTYVEHGPRFRDHRALFRLAPKAAVLALALFAVPAVLVPWSAGAAIATVIILAALAAALTGIGLHSLGSIQYSREHYDTLVKKYYESLAILSRFPETNPNLEIKVGAEGQVAYANPATRRLLRRLGLGEGAVDAILPDGFAALVTACLEDATTPRETEVMRFGRHLRYSLSAFPDEQSVIAAGTDVTYLRRIEQELRVLNQDLERLVQERTHELHETQDVTILSLAGLAETRDPETGQHLQRTRLYVRLLAESLRDHPRFRDVLDDSTIDQLYKSTPLHDIGKVGVPDAILRKPGPLTAKERTIMREHTRYGGDALQWAEKRLGFDSFLGLARDIAYHHHERWDGTGYPQGLRGDAIPWPARLMALADVYDALTSARYYKEAMGHEESRDFIARERGKHFDPDVVDAFMAHEEEFAEIAAKFADEGVLAVQE
jgi:response regulator RpfG family c-di-GMP phosphodiesterase